MVFVFVLVPLIERIIEIHTMVSTTVRTQTSCDHLTKQTQNWMNQLNKHKRQMSAAYYDTSSYCSLNMTS